MTILCDSLGTRAQLVDDGGPGAFGRQAPAAVRGLEVSKGLSSCRARRSRSTSKGS